MNSVSPIDETAVPMRAVGIKTQFGPNVIHENLDFTINRGEIVGLVGGSGSGKSVLMNTMLGLKEPEGGYVEYFGKNRNELDAVTRRYINNQMGVLFPGGALFSSMSVRENVMIPMRENTDLSPKLMRELADMKIHMVGLPPESAVLHPSDLSGGMKKRAGLARALALDPKLLFLDEPTVGVDVQSKNVIMAHLKKLNADGTTILYTSHHINEAELFCTQIAIIDHGKIILTGKPKTLIKNEPNAQNLEDVFLSLTGKELRDYA